MTDNFMLFVTILLPLVGGTIGYWIKDSIDKRKELLGEVNKERRKLYQEFVNLIIDLLKGTKTGESIKEDELVDKLFEFYKKYVLYGSPGVINSISDFFQYSYSGSNKGGYDANKEYYLKLSKILFEMRKDLGLSNKNLGSEGERILRALISDYDDMIG